MIKKFDEFINEALTQIPLESIMKNGQYVASTKLHADKMEYMRFPRYEFVFGSEKQLRNFCDTTYCREFWLALYDYDDVIQDNNDYTLIDANMKKFNNVIVGKTLYIYAYNKSDVAELKQRCENAAKKYKFKSIDFIETSPRNIFLK